MISEMTLWVKCWPHKLEDLSLIPRTKLRMEEVDPLRTCLLTLIVPVKSAYSSTLSQHNNK